MGFGFDDTYIHMNKNTQYIISASIRFLKIKIRCRFGTLNISLPLLPLSEEIFTSKI